MLECHRSPSPYAALLLLLLLAAVHAASPMRPRPRYERAMNASLEAEEQLGICRAGAVNETLRDIRCFVAALERFPHNASWCKQLGALYVTTAQRVLALELFNRSTYTILEANGFIGPRAPTNATPVSLLKLYFVREGDRGVELGKVWTKALQLQHRSVAAAAVLDDFLTWEADFDEAIDLYRELGSIADVLKLKRRKFEHRARERAERREGKAKRMPERQKFLAQLAEEVPRLVHDMASRYLSGGLTATELGRNETRAFNRDRCGTTLPYSVQYRATDLVAFVASCLSKWSEYRALLAHDAAPEPYGALMRTPLHSLAAYGTDFLVRHVAEAHPALLDAHDNFGWTPMHIAVAHGNKRAISVLLKIGGPKQLGVQDAGGFTPLKLGCMNPRFRSTMEQLARAALQLPNPCSPYEPPTHVVDDENEDEDDDEIPAGGNWEAAAHTADTARCEFDIRNGESMSHHELVGRYLHQSRPVVLRDIVPVTLREVLMKNRLRSRRGDMLVRSEAVPAAQHFGALMHNITTLRQWLSRGPNASFATIETNRAHTLGAEAFWVPPRLVNGDAGKGYVNTDDSWPTVLLAKAGAVTNHVIRSTHEIFALVHGVQTWALRQPQDAMTTGSPWAHNVSDERVIACTIHSGDVLVIPQLWSAAARSHGESAGVRRRLVWK